MSQSPNNELSQSIVAIAAILGLVVVVEFFVLSMMAGGVGDNQIDAMAEDPAAIDARIRPVMTLADIRGDNSSAMTAAPVVAKKSAKELYDVTCMACHANGVAGAPKPGDKAAWEGRYANGMDSLLASVVNGKGAMPPRGGSAFSDDEITTIIEYMLTESGLMEAKTEAPVAITKEAPMAEKAAEPMAEAKMDIAAGEKAYGTDCFACHGTGAAGAPVLGNAAAWAGRTGLDALTASAINGKGAMPPKGGAAHLSDAEIKNIVGFMLSKI